MDRLFYILGANGEPERTDVLTWGRWIDTHREARIVARNELPEGVTVSTMFMGLDLNPWPTGGPPMLWETMIFGGPLHQHCDRYTSKDAAVAGHAEALALASDLAPPDRR